MITVERMGPALSEADIRGFEKRLGHQLPDTYRDFLLRTNGGRPVPDSFDFHDGRSGSSVHFFYSINGSNKTERFDWVLTVFHDRVPDGFLPFARDPFGNLLCIQLSGPGTGRVYFWDHEAEAEEGEPATMENMTLVSENFQAFISSLREFSAD